MMRRRGKHLKCGNIRPQTVCVMCMCMFEQALNKSNVLDDDDDTEGAFFSFRSTSLSLCFILFIPFFTTLFISFTLDSLSFSENESKI